MIITGYQSVISEGAQIASTVTVEMGDFSSISSGVVIVGKGRLKLGDYVKVHRGCFIVVNSDVTLGHNTWVGERTVLDGTAPLTIGNNVGIGISSQVYTHISFGDAFSGCRLRSSKACTLANEAWLVGHVILQAVSLAPRTVIMPGSNVTSDVKQPNTICSGNPCVDVTQKMGGPPWNEVTVEQKLRRFERLLHAYEAEVKNDCYDKFIACPSLPPKGERYGAATYFDVDRQIYTKTRSNEEHTFMSWLLTHNKAKFIPEAP